MSHFFPFKTGFLKIVLDLQKSPYTAHSVSPVNICVSVVCFHISFGFSWLWQFLRLVLFLMALTDLRNTSQVFFGVPLYGICHLFFSWLDGWWIFLGKTKEEGAKFHHIMKGTYYKYDLSLFMLTLIHSDEVVYAQFLHCKVLFFLFPYYTF